MQQTILAELTKLHLFTCFIYLLACKKDVYITFGLIFISCRIKVIFGRLTCLDTKISIDHSVIVFVDL